MKIKYKQTKIYDEKQFPNFDKYNMKKIIKEINLYIT